MGCTHMYFVLFLMCSTAARCAFNCAVIRMLVPNLGWARFVPCAYIFPESMPMDQSLRIAIRNAERPISYVYYACRPSISVNSNSCCVHVSWIPTLRCPPLDVLGLYWSPVWHAWTLEFSYVSRMRVLFYCIRNVSKSCAIYLPRLCIYFSWPTFDLCTFFISWILVF